MSNKIPKHQKPYICKHTEHTGNMVNFVKETCPNKKSTDGVPKELCRECEQFEPIESGDTK